MQHIGNSVSTISMLSEQVQDNHRKNKPTGESIVFKSIDRVVREDLHWDVNICHVNRPHHSNTSSVYSICQQELLANSAEVIINYSLSL